MEKKEIINTLSTIIKSLDNKPDVKLDVELVLELSIELLEEACRKGNRFFDMSHIMNEDDVEVEVGYDRRIEVTIPEVSYEDICDVMVDKLSSLTEEEVLGVYNKKLGIENN